MGDESHEVLVWHSDIFQLHTNQINYAKESMQKKKKKKERKKEKEKSTYNVKRILPWCLPQQHSPVWIP